MSIGDVVKLNFTTSPISYFDIRAAGDEGLCIDDYDVSLLEDHASVGDQDPLSAFYQNDDRVAGDVQVADAVPDPGVAFLKGDLLELDVLVLAKGFRAEDHYVICAQPHVPAGDQYTVVPFYYCHDHALREIELGDGMIDPGIPLCQMDLDEMDVRFLSVFAHPLDAGILIDESGGNDTGRDRHHADSEKGDEDTEHFSQCGDRVDIAVSDGEQCGSGPPDPGECVGKYFRLCFVLQAVHAQTGRQHEDQNGEYRRKELLFLAREHFRDQLEGVVVCVYPKQAEYPHDPQHPERYGSRGEEDGKKIRQK